MTHPHQAPRPRPWDRIQRSEPTALGTWLRPKTNDPVPALHKVHCPVLAMFGESDPLVPARQSAEIWKTALREAGNHDVVVNIFPHAGHAMGDPRTGAPVPGFIARQRDWLLKHVTVGN